MSRLGQKRVSLEALGLLFLCRLLAGKCQDGGHISIGNVKRATEEDLIKLLKSDHNAKPAAAAKLIKELHNAGFFVPNRRKKILLTDWETEQATPKTYEAAKKAAQRERATAEQTESAQTVDITATASQQAAAADAAALASVSAFGLGESKGTMSPTSGGHCPQELEPEPKKEIHNSISISTGKPSSARAAASAAHTDYADGVDIYDPRIPAERVACLITGQRGTYALNGFRKKCREVGEEVFRQALGEVRAAVDDGTARRPEQLLHFVCNRLAGEYQAAAEARAATS